MIVFSLCTLCGAPESRFRPVVDNFTSSSGFDPSVRACFSWCHVCFSSAGRSSSVCRSKRVVRSRASALRAWKTCRAAPKAVSARESNACIVTGERLRACAVQQMEIRMEFVVTVVFIPRRTKQTIVPCGNETGLFSLRTAPDTTAESKQRFGHFAFTLGRMWLSRAQIIHLRSSLHDLGVGCYLRRSSHYRLFVSSLLGGVFYHYLIFVFLLNLRSRKDLMRKPFTALHRFKS